jgi:hypothetical protein
MLSLSKNLLNTITAVDGDVHMSTLQQAEHA